VSLRNNCHWDGQVIKGDPLVLTRLTGVNRLGAAGYAKEGSNDVITPKTHFWGLRWLFLA
jgi:hypothetical protein